MSMDRSTLRWNGWGWAAADKAPPPPPDEAWTWMAQEMGVPALLATPAREAGTVPLPPSKLTERDLAQLRIVLGGDAVRTDDAERLFHARGRSYLDLLLLRAGALPALPDAVLYPADAAAVLSALAFAQEQDLAIVPFGGGSSVVGGVSPERGTKRAVLTLDLSHMDKLTAVDPVAMTATAEAGMYGPAFEKALAAEGVTLGHYPQSFEFSTLGGWIAARGAGQMSARYGKAERWLVSARLATPKGLWSTEGFPASAAGPRLTDMVVGSEGTLGVIVDATVKVRPLPERTGFACWLFPDFESGVAAVRAMVRAEAPVAMLRLSDPEEMYFFRTFGRIGHAPTAADAAANAYLKLRGVPARPAALIATLEGSAGTVAHAKALTARIARAQGGVYVGEGPGRSWLRTRFAAPYSRDAMMDRGLGVDTLETATAWSNVRRLYDAVRAALKKAIDAEAPAHGTRAAVMCHMSHVYPDGASLYFTFVFPRAPEREVEQWRAIKQAASDAIAANGGTISHHHGVGEDHKAWMPQEKGEIGMSLLRALKRELDPAGVLNPGKLI